MQTDVELRDPKTLDEAMQQAERADGIMYSFQRGNSSNIYHSQDKSTQNGPQPMELGQVEVPKRKGKHADVECFECGKKGHIRRFCPDKQKN